tara:strand:- start:408 stop:740 length:333 start_codon:yes stop_codon:yes gene_type:complete
MKFDRTTVTISINKSTKEIFELANKKKPAHISMSTWIAVMIEDYLNTHKDNSSILDFAEKNVEASVPIFFAPISNWEQKVKSMTPEDFIRLQNRHNQLGNLIQREGERRC